MENYKFNLGDNMIVQVSELKEDYSPISRKELIIFSDDDYEKLKDFNFRKYYKENLQRKIFKNPIIGDILISGSGMGETEHNNRYTQKWLILITKLPEMLTKSTECELDVKQYKPRRANKQSDFVGIDYIYSHILYGNLLLDITIVIYKDKFGKRYYSFNNSSFNDKINKKESSNHNPRKVGGIGTSNNSITDTQENFNSSKVLYKEKLSDNHNIRERKMEEKKFCMKSRAELDEIRKQQASKKASMNEAKQMTNKDIRAAFGTLICLPNGNGELTRYLDRYAYNAGTFGWNYDVFISPEDYSVGIVTGYRVPNSMCDFKISYDDMAQAEDEVSALDVRGEEKAKAVNDILMGLLNKTTGGVSESKINEISDETVNNAFTKLDAEFDKEAIKWGVKPYKKGVSKSFDKAFDRYERFGKLNKKRLERKYKSESLTASKALAMSKSILDEISDEKVYNTVAQRDINQRNAMKKYWRGEGSQEDVTQASDKSNKAYNLAIQREKNKDKRTTKNSARAKVLRGSSNSTVARDYYKNLGMKSESKINEISDELAQKVANKREINQINAKRKYDDAWNKYSETRKDGDYSKASRATKELDTAIRKREKSAKLMNRRQARKMGESKINESKDYKFDNIVISIYGEPTENSKVVEEKMSGFGMQNLEIINVYNSEDEAVQDHLARIKAGEQPDPLVYETQETIDFINKHHHLPSLDADDFDAEYSAWAD